MEYFTPYEGKNPFVFVSYAHRNSALVLPVAARLHAGRYRVWYDEGIPAGTDWPKSVQKHLQRCACVLFFLSKESLASDNCFSEIATARKRGKPVFVVRLDDSPAAGRWAGLPGDSRTVVPDELEEILGERFLCRPGEKVSDDPGRHRFNGWVAASVLSALLLFASLYGSWGLKNGRFEQWLPAEPTPAPMLSTPVPAPAHTPDPRQWEDLFPDMLYLQFPDPEQEDAVCLALGTDGTENIPIEEAQNVRELYFCGALTADSEEHIRWQDGHYMLRTAVPGTGRVNDLTLLAKLLNLQKLVLVNQPVNSIAALGNLPALRELSLAGCPAVTLSGLKGFPALETLHLEHSGVRDLSPLQSLPGLQTVTVSADMLPLTLDAAAPYDVFLIE